MQHAADGDLCIVWGSVGGWGTVQSAAGGEACSMQWVGGDPYGGPMQHAAGGDPCSMQQMGTQAACGPEARAACAADAGCWVNRTILKAHTQACQLVHNLLEAAQRGVGCRRASARRQ